MWEPARYKIAYSGRGAAKSWSFARYLISIAYTRKTRILCVREYQSSISDSVLRLLADQIELLGLLPWFNIQATSITCTLTGTEFVFKGIKLNPQGLKSLEGFAYCWCEEAENISEESWLTLIPTIRKAGSEILISFNVHLATDATYKRFVLTPNKDAIVRHTSWEDNPEFPITLDAERRYMLENDPENYEWVWAGNPRQISDAVIFRNRVSFETFETPETAQFYHGVDWGFARDPTVMVRSFIVGEELFIDREAYGLEVELDNTPALFDLIPTSRSWPIFADNSNPAQISYVRRQGFAISEAAKWPGSIEDGIAHLKAFKRIVVHDRCKHTGREFRTYSFKKDARTGAVMPIVADKNNHCIAHGELVETARGQVPIQDVVIGDMVLTRQGLRRVYSAGLTSSSREIWELKAGRRTLRATRDHEVYTFSRGLVRMDALRYSDVVYVRKDAGWRRLRYSGTGATLGKGIQRLLDCLTETISVDPSVMGTRFTFTELFGKMRTALSQRVITSITGTLTPAIMPLKTWNAYLPLNTGCGIQNDQNCGSGGLNTLRAFDRAPPLGTALQRGLRSISALVRWLMSASSQNLSLAHNALRSSCLERLGTKTSFAQTPASQRPGEIAGSMMRTGYAEDATKYSGAAAMTGSGFALASVSSLRDSGMRGPVYDLSVEGDPEFIASGIVVSNCLDSIRYSLNGFIKSRSSAAIWARMVE